ncbi:flagellar biosynthesis chaperone [Opitutaceae bacterium TAV1]|nr:flagellar biosynthesis chaperone [Opitutaceae bacterium TAV5]EIQ00369.1 flagellar biosynthesis chaperone [Opitutaceae bacterium TAV1]
MKRFRFSLQSVLTVRDIAEQQQRGKLALVLRAHAEAKVALEAARLRVVEAANELCAVRIRAFLAGEQPGFVRAWQTSCEAERRAVEALRLARESLAQARAGWIAARRNLQVLENLRQRARQRHRRECDRVEQMLLDEFASLRFARARIFPDS